MSKDGIERPTAVTKITKSSRSSEHATMSFTAVTSHKAMAEAFVNELTRVALQIIPERAMSAADIIEICQLAMKDRSDQNITLVGGRHLRARISEQVSRANRYKEPFTLVVLNLNNVNQGEDYDSVVDTLRERMRQTDLMFLFKYRIVLLLPHTDKEACDILVGRIQELVQSCLVNMPVINTTTLTYPHPNISKSSAILDWTENQLRS